MEEFNTLRITHDFGKTFDWQIKDGRDFSQEFRTDSTAFVINEAAVRYMGLEEPVGTRVQWGENGEYTIIGVVEDMLMYSPSQSTLPVIFFLVEEQINLANIKIKPEASLATVIETVEKIYQKYDPLNVFEYRFIDEEHAEKFQNEERIARLASVLAVLAILISCLGLLGMVSFVTEKRNKEISIRKVLGASIINLWQLVSNEFVVLVGIAALISIPIAYYFLSNWLDGFTYRINISPWIFLLVTIAALALCLLTVSYKAIKAALANPIKALRSD